MKEISQIAFDVNLSPRMFVVFFFHLSSTILLLRAAYDERV